MGGTFTSLGALKAAIKKEVEEAMQAVLMISIFTGPIMPMIFIVKQNPPHGLGLTKLLSPWNSWTVWFPLCFCRDSLCPISLLLIRNPSLVL